MEYKIIPEIQGYQELLFSVLHVFTMCTKYIVKTRSAVSKEGETRAKQLRQ